MIHNLAREGDSSRGLRIDYGNEIEQGIEKVANALKRNVPDKEQRWWALKLLEGENAPPEMTAAAKVTAQVRTELATRHKHDAASAIIERRYGFINGIVRECVLKRTEISQRLLLSETIDNIVLNRWLGVPLFFLLMALTFYIVFALGTPIAELIGRLFY
ncbi:MAG: hypothetical protein ABIK18_00380, partial [candidate division WOR-3 bacterium]